MLFERKQPGQDDPTEGRLALTEEPERQARVVAAMSAWEVDPPEWARLLDPFEYVASANYVVPMLFHLATIRGDHIVDHVPRYSSLDHAVNWMALIKSIRRFETFAAPYLDWPLVTDPFAEELLDFELRKEQRHHWLASFEHHLWQLVSDDQGLRIRLAAPIRRSALHLVSSLANRDNMPVGARDVLDRTPKDVAGFARASGTTSLAVLADSDPESWEAFCSGLGFRLELLPHFRAWVLGLHGEGNRWLKRADLHRSWEAGGLPECAPGELDEMINLHAVTVEEAESWGVQAPFIRLGEFFVVWFFAFHVLHPDLGFLTLAIRKHEELWSRTVGSSLAMAADWIGARLPAGRLEWRARRRKKGVGEADLLLLDVESGHVAVLEVKTTFDKFRSHVQLSNFVQQRVNFPKAVSQACAGSEALSDGRWRLKEIFGTAAPAMPTGVSVGVLTWWDTFNPTLGSPDETLCCNFDTLGYVMKQASGDLSAALSAIRELAHIYCPGVLVPAEITIDGESWPIRREVQTDALPPPSALSGASTLTRHLVDGIPQLPTSWETLPSEFPVFMY